MKNVCIVKLLLFCIFLLTTTSVFAQRVIDNAGLFTDHEKENLQQFADSLSLTYNFDLIIVTERDIGNISPEDYANNFFEYEGYGFGVNQDGCLFLQVIGSRDYWFSTSGRGIRLLTMTAGNKLEIDVLKYLRVNNFYQANRAFLLGWEEFLILDAKGGRTYNFFYRWNAVLVIAVWLIAIAIGFGIVQKWKSQMNTALAKVHASGYIIPGSLKFSEKSDRFLYSRVSKTRRQTDSSSGGSSRSSSSGMSFGGRGGKF